MNGVLFSTASALPFARRLADLLGLPVSGVERRQFPDGETYLRFEIGEWLQLPGRHVVLVGATDTDASLAELFRLGCAAVQNGARSLILVVPYFGYSTMERAVRPGESVAAKAVARQLSALPRAAQGNWVLLMDLHAAGIVYYFEGDTVALELYAEPRVLEVVSGLRLPRLCLASTDMGRAKWVESLANRLNVPIALIHKKRLSGSQTRVLAVVGDVAGMDVVIYDDMIRTGGSLVQAAEAYMRAGAASVRTVVTHLVLPEGAVERLEASPLLQIIGTDTHPHAARVEGRPKFQVVSVADLFADGVRRLVQ